MTANWEQTVSWLVLFFILVAIISGRIRFELAAFGGLLFLGLLRVGPATTLFSGFASPALFTVILILVMSDGIVASGVLTGFGQAIARRVHQPEKQILAVALSASLLGLFMNNVGAISLLLPTSQRMARRVGIEKADFGMPLTYATILGGSITLIGTAPNLIVSAFRVQAAGEPFRMFDFAAHGLTMAGIGLAMWYICRLCGYRPVRTGGKVGPSHIADNADSDLLEPTVPRSKRNTTIVLVTLGPAIVLASIGLVHPAYAFGFVVLSWIAVGILSHTRAYQAVNMPILVFLGSILSISAILTETGALPAAVNLLVPLVDSLPPLGLTLAFVFATALIANALDNNVSAVIMAPAAILLYQSGTLGVTLDALLMAVAAGASLGIVIPTHQATLVAMHATGFSPREFMKTGAVIVLPVGMLAALVITAVWN